MQRGAPYLRESHTDTQRIQASVPNINRRLTGGRCSRGRYGNLRGQQRRKRAATRIGTRQYQPPMMRYRNPPRDGQPQARAPAIVLAARSRLVRSEKTLEHALL